MKNDWTKSIAITLLLVAAAFSRLIPHPSNFTAIGALAIFGAATLPNRFLAFILPLVAMWISDLVINNLVYGTTHDFMWFTSGALWIYGGIVMHSLAAWWMVKKNNVPQLVGASALGAVSFFLLSNFGVWFGSAMYPASAQGLLMCYTAAIPFFGNMLAGTLFFGAILFGIQFLLEKKAKVVPVA